MRPSRRIGALPFAAVLLFATAFDPPPAAAGSPAPVTIFTPSGNDSAQNPAFSPDGTRIVFTIWHDGYNVGAAGLHLVPFAGGAATPLIDDGDSNIVNLPGSSWSPTLDRITFSSDADGIDDIWTIAPNGSTAVNLTQLTPGTIHYQEPSFSPDGSRIVFEIVDETTARGEIWRIDNDPDDVALTPVIDLDESSPFSDRQPNWSPAGDRIVFQRQMQGEEFVNLFLVDSDGSDLQQLTFFDATTPGAATDASFAPDGSWVVYSGTDATITYANLFGIPAGGGTAVRITNDDARYDGAPSWSPDGDWIAYESSLGDPEGGATELRRIASPIEVPEPSSMAAAAALTMSVLALQGRSANAPIARARPMQSDADTIRQ